ncbi:Mitochondrial inner membrane magnesium transporter MRS2 [Meyerozyma sp. JA9]|nr:Mitochondrial inner membrane magnesium transporter MRS2 [Meyerozyma sp. JA9]
MYCTGLQQSLRSSCKPLFKCWASGGLSVVRSMSTKTRNHRLEEIFENKKPPQAADKADITRKLKPVTPNDLFVSCTKFDSKGNIVEVSKNYPKMQFLKENDLFPRDLRNIETTSLDIIPSFIIRSPASIIVNLLHIKALIKKDQVMIFDTSTPEIAKKLGLFMYDLEMVLRLPSGNTPFEFRVLEGILISTTTYLETEMKSHASICNRILAELEEDVDRTKLQELLIRSKRLSSFHQRTLLIRDVLDDLLDNDEDLAAMYMTHPKRYDPTVDNPTDYSDLEMLLEAYYNHCDELVQQAGSLLNDIKVTEEIVNIILDSNRNSLMVFELKVAIYTLGFTVATLLPAFYGMNLKNYIEDSNLGFAAVVVFSIIQGVIITAINFRKLRGVQKLPMMGKKDNRRQGGRRYNWHHWWRAKRRTKYDRPTSSEKDVLWRMINDDKPLK